MSVRLLLKSFVENFGQNLMIGRGGWKAVSAITSVKRTERMRTNFGDISVRCGNPAALSELPLWRRGSLTLARFAERATYGYRLLFPLLRCGIHCCPNGRIVRAFKLKENNASISRVLRTFHFLLWVLRRSKPEFRQNLAAEKFCGWRIRSSASDVANWDCLFGII